MYVDSTMSATVFLSSYAATVSKTMQQPWLSEHIFFYGLL